MEKRVLLAVALMFAVLFVYDYFVAPKFMTPVPPPTVQDGTAPAAAPTPVAAGATPAAPSPAAGTPPAPAASAVKTLVADTAAHEIVVETDTVRAVFSTAGATLRHWQLKRYSEDGTGQPFDVVPQDVPDTLPKAFTLATDDPALSATLAGALFQPSTTKLTLPGTNSGTLSFDYRDESGLNAHKTFSFQPDGLAYTVTVAATVDVKGAARPVKVLFGPALGLGYMPDGSRAVDAQALLYRDDKMGFLSMSTLAKEPTYDGTFRIAGAGEQYFISVALPQTQTAHVDFNPIQLAVKDAPKTQRKLIAWSVRVPGDFNMKYFLGPKDFDALKAVDPQLVYSIEFGYFRVIVTPLLQALKQINSVVGNWGGSIIVLTVLINLLIFPLRHRSMVSMRKMQAAQPEIKAIQDRYAKYKFTDPEKGKMQTELAALYKQKGINPVSGCVPMLLTFPILLAFYAMLSAAIELRGAPFLGWIHDLSLRDPYYVTPVLMGATMFWQQRMTPAPGGDPVQQKMMMFLPIMFTGMFLWAPAGMVLYWLFSNLMGILQQTMTLKMIGGPGTPPSKPGAKPRPPKAIVGSGSPPKP